MLSARLVKRRGDAFALEAAFEVEAGTTLVLAGESGSGKSTVLRLLAGIETPDAGHIALGETTWLDTASRPWILRPAQEREVGWVPQDYALFPHLDVFENVGFGLRARGAAGGEVRTRVDAALARFGVADLARRRPAGLSGGQQQRVALARALVHEPRLLLLDEPLAALDLQTRQTVRGDLRQLLADLPVVTLFVTHSPVEAMLFGDRIAVLEGGRLVQVGNRDELLRRPRSPYVAQFMGLNLFSGRVVERRPDGVAKVATDDGTVTVADTEGSAGELFVAVSPREITLYRTPPDGSAQNLYRGPVLEMVPEPPLGERVRVVLGTRPHLVAEVTRSAVIQLALAEGVEVYASFKATGAVAYS
jgi:molybdate transport system ATP-binding protein